MLLQFLTNNEVLDQVEVTETLINANLKISNSSKSLILKLFDELKTISQRDVYELHIETSGELVSISESSQEYLLKLENHFYNHSDSELSEIELNIDKSAIDGVVSIYFIDYFAAYLSKERLLNLIISFSKVFTDKLFFEVFSNISEFGSSSIHFFESNSKGLSCKPQVSQFTREDKLELFSSNGITSNIQTNLLPSDFNLILESSNNQVNKFFYDVGTILSFVFIANSSELKDSNEFNYKISGYKTNSYKTLNINSDSSKFKILLRIFSWVYEGGTCSDKLGLVRNVISIHQDRSGEILIDEDVWSAIQSNYNIYLKGNIHSYLEVKNKIGELILESTAKTFSLVDDLLDSLKNNAFILLSFILTVVVINGLKDSGETVVFSNQYVLVVGILSAVSLLWLLMTRTEVFRRYDNASSNVLEVLQVNYNKILMASEIDDIVKPIIDKNRRYLKSQVNRYSLWWIGMLGLVLIGFIIGNTLFANTSLLTRGTTIKKLAIINQSADIDHIKNNELKENLKSTSPKKSIQIHEITNTNKKEVN